MIKVDKTIASSGKLIWQRKIIILNGDISSNGYIIFHSHVSLVEGSLFLNSVISGEWLAYFHSWKWYNWNPGKSQRNRKKLTQTANSNGQSIMKQKKQCIFFSVGARATASFQKNGGIWYTYVLTPQGTLRASWCATWSRWFQPFFWEHIGKSHSKLNSYTIQGTNISHLGKRKIIFKSTCKRGYVSSQECRYKESS